jgi:NAD(P)-dependent dehydrogenase (short-subunit alcohol dehydrogenase family)
VVPGSVATDAEGAALASVLAALRRPLGGVVVSLSGSRERARLLEQPNAFLEATLQANVLPVLVAARQLVPLLAAAQRRLPFLVLGGPAADVPWAGYGQLSVAASAQRMLVRVLREELADESVRIQQVVVGAPVRTEERSHCACAHWPSALEVGRQVRAVLADTHSREAVVRLAPPTQLPPNGAAPRGGHDFPIEEASS